LRPATNRDWHSIGLLLYENKLPQEGAREHLAHFVVATTDGVIVGCAGAELYGDIALLRSVAIVPLLHGKGIGKMLVNRLIQEAKERKIAKIYLLTISAQEYFEHFGFQPELIDKAPQSLKASAEFQGACPAGATFMSLTLGSSRYPL